MLFSSPVFLFFFLPAVLLGYYLLRPQYRNGFLLGANLIFYAWGEPVYVFLMLGSITMNYLFGLWIERRRVLGRSARGVLAMSVAANLGLLGFFKYTGLFVQMFSAIPAFAGMMFPEILLPIGISFYTFQTMSYVIDVYRGEVPAQRSYVAFGTYVSLFPQLIAGPIVRYRDIDEQLTDRAESVTLFGSGVLLFTVGLAKKVLIANQMGEFFNLFQSTPLENGAAGSWIGIAAFAFQIYFDFSGYSDMAIGLGRMFGFEFLRNFNYPYISKSITDFWHRWHISLSTWFRDYLYIPLGGSRKGTVRTILNLFIVWSLTGLWHGASINFVLWGVYYFVLLVLEKFVYTKSTWKPPVFLRWLYTIVLVAVGWVIFNFTDFELMQLYLVSMFGGGTGVVSDQIGPIAFSMIPLFAIAAIASTPVVTSAYLRIPVSRAGTAVTFICVAGLLVLCTASMVSGAYNPFLYFRF